MRPGEINVDPIEGEFFSTEAIGSITDAVVRESIQNSLDADDGLGPVTVCLSFNPAVGGRAQPDRQRYLSGLAPHLQARHSGLQELPSPEEAIDYLLIEDYGTHGLQGDIYQYDDLEDDTRRNDFYYFWRNIGRTRKESADRGRWGLGKTVFQAASRINSFFGLTVRKDDGRALLMGQSVLKIHKVENTRYAPYGYFAVFDDELALPMGNKAYLEEFSRQFNFDRLGRPGLSVLLPYPDRGIDLRGCLWSVVKHYFFPILSGHLVVKLKDPEKLYTLDALSLDALLRRPRFKEGPGLIGRLDLARWAIQQTENTFIPLKMPEPGRAPKLREDLFDPEQLQRIKQRFAENDRIAFHVPISIQRVGGSRDEPVAGVFGFKPLKLSAIKGGFSLTCKPDGGAIPKTIGIQMAYEVRSGNPFKKYTPLDFDVAAPPIQIFLDGARTLLNKHNVIHLEVQRADFKVSVTGFDMHRDLRIKTFP